MVNIWRSLARDLRICSTLHCALECTSRHSVSVAQWLTQWTYMREVPGSIPIDVTCLFHHCISYGKVANSSFFMARLTIVRGPYVFALSVRPSVHGGQIFVCLKTRFMGFWEGLGCFWRFRFLSCVRACVTLYVLSFVGWTCPRVLVRSRKPFQYELKLCTSYFWSTSVRPSVRQNGRNIASHTGLLVIFFSIFWIELVLGF